MKNEEETSILSNEGDEEEAECRVCRGEEVSLCSDYYYCDALTTDFVIGIGTTARSAMSLQWQHTIYAWGLSYRMAGV